MEIIEIFKTIILPGAFTALFAWMLWRTQKNSRDHPDNIAALQLLITEIQEERDKYREHNRAYEGERALLISKIAELERSVAELQNGHEAERVAWTLEKDFLTATIENLNSKIEELENKIAGVKNDTDELKKKTGPLK